MKKKNIIILSSIILIIIFVVTGILLLQNNNKKINKKIVFYQTQGFINIDESGYGLLVLNYYNAGNFDESNFDSKISLLGSDDKRINDLSYVIKEVNKSSYYDEKQVMIALQMQDYSSFIIEKIVMSETNSYIYNIGSLKIVKNERVTETNQGYVLTISSFSSVEIFESYQSLVLTFKNDSDHDVFIESINAGKTELINKNIKVGESLKMKVDCSNYFDAWYIIVGGYINYTSKDVQYSCSIETLTYIKSITEAKVLEYIANN